jgi:hypothetical protein
MGDQAPDPCEGSALPTGGRQKEELNMQRPTETTATDSGCSQTPAVDPAGASAEDPQTAADFELARQSYEVQ